MNRHLGTGSGCDDRRVVVRTEVGAGDRVRWRARLVLATAAILVVLGGCAAAPTAAPGVPDAELTAALAEVPTVSLRGPDNPTLDPEVLAEFWDSARVRSATPPPASPVQGSMGLAPPAIAVPEDRGPAGQGVPFAQALLVRGPTGPALSPELDGSVALPPVVGEVTDAPVLDEGGSGGVASRTTGRLFFTVGSQPRSCTAAVVTSGSRSVVATAGHCLLTADSGGDRLAATNFLFGPGYVDGQFPFGRWTVESVHLASGWSSSADWSQDVAFLRMAPSTANGERLQAVVGALGVVFDLVGAARPGVTTALLGYPSVPPFDGSSLRWCATASPAPPPPVAPDGFGLRCAMTAGYSGGPAVAGFDPETGAGFVVGIGSHDYGAGTVFGASLGSAALAAYVEADQG